MSLTESFIREIEHESANTRKMLERIPPGQFDWKPHQKSMSLKNLASHITGLSAWPGVIVKSQYLDLAVSNSNKTEIKTTSDLIDELDRNVKQSIDALKSVQDENLKEYWSLKRGDHVIFEMPKSAVIRSMALNHSYHHRAQLGVYLRILNISVPGMYGPSADEV
ncbi:MAG: DinB family protein [Bacteroidia bacterium]|nr:DinB family protein [Bacteroidia bacterium]MCZ2278215.1 DinB family protein [Bacteroidia bacterium]